MPQLNWPGRGIRRYVLDLIVCAGILFGGAMIGFAAHGCSGSFVEKIVDDAPAPTSPITFEPVHPQATYTISFPEANVSAPWQRSVREWNAAVGFDLLIIADSGPADIVISTGDTNKADGIAEWDNAGVFMDSAFCHIILRSPFVEATLIEHEEGHCLGFMHSQNIGSIMHATVLADAVIGQDLINDIHQMEAGL